jgi:SagB-type dehydrogenase family enzyme
MSTIPLDHARDLALLFHLNSEPWMNQQAYDEPSVLHAFRSIETAEPVALPPPETTPLFDLIRSRYSCRNFTDAPMPLDELATLLHQGYGILGLHEFEGVALHHRPTPSAGALFPLELYLIANNVTGLPKGAYHYASWRHRLERLQDGIGVADLMPQLQEQHYVLNASVLIFLTAIFDRTMKKYGPRGYRYILLEAGHVAQNLCLLATERKLGALCLGGFRDAYFNRLFRLDSRTEGCVYALAIGRPA